MTEAHKNSEKKTISIPVYPIIIAVIAGGLFGHYSAVFAVKTKILGEIFLSLLFVLVIPLIMSSLICGVTSLGDIRHLEKLGLKTVVFYLTSTFIAVVTGLILVNIISPGKNTQVSQTEYPTYQMLSGDQFQCVFQFYGIKSHNDKMESGLLENARSRLTYHNCGTCK